MSGRRIAVKQLMWPYGKTVWRPYSKLMSCEPLFVQIVLRKVHLWIAFRKLLEWSHNRIHARSLPWLVLKHSDVVSCFWC